MAKYRLLKDAKLKGKKVLVRVDHNIEKDADGRLKNDEKIRATLPTIKFLLKSGARVILMTHVGRPKGKKDPTLSTRSIAEYLERLLSGISIVQVSETVGPVVDKVLSGLKNGSILYLENVRFHPEEEGDLKEQAAFGKCLAALADLYVNEAFASCHEYEEASTCAVARLLPSFAGMHLQREVEMLSPVLRDPRRPLVLIISGAKMETKIPVVEHFLGIGDDILLGGAIANTFIAARGFDIGMSKYEPDFVGKCQDMMLEAEKMEKADIHVPRDVVVASEPSATAERLDIPVEDVEGDMRILDVGKVTTERFVSAIEKAGMVVWNGPLGMYEYEPFSHATKRVAQVISQETKKRGMLSILGGGDTIDFHHRYRLPLDTYTFVSTGGGAMLEFMSGKSFPALEILTHPYV